MRRFTRRQPFYTASAGVRPAVENDHVDGLIAAHSITTLIFLVEQYTNHQQAELTISDLLRVFQGASVDQNVLMQAMALNWRDFEDAVQVCAAVEAGERYIISRDATDFDGAGLPVLSPTDRLAATTMIKRHLKSCMRHQKSLRKINPKRFHQTSLTVFLCAT